MHTQNITLTLPQRVLREVKVIAAKKRTSVSRLLTVQLEELIVKERGYARARVRHLALLERAPDLGTGGISVKREVLHER